MNTNTYPVMRKLAINNLHDNLNGLIMISPSFRAQFPRRQELILVTFPMLLSQGLLAYRTRLERSPKQTRESALIETVLAYEVPVLAGLPSSHVLLLPAGVAYPPGHNYTPLLT